MARSVSGLLSLLAGASLQLSAAPPATSPASAIDFSREIQPLFARHCFECHGPDKQKSGLRLDQKAAAFAGGDSGKVIVPGSSRASRLFQLVAGLEADLLMPPEGKGKPLAPDQIGLIKTWIEQGAPWPDQLAARPGRDGDTHWAFVAPQRPALPAVKNRAWMRNAIDYFILARLEHENIAPSPAADRTTLFRRVSLDLTGTAPRPEEIEPFINDTRPDAYERLVDRLLASPQYGEQWARHWLDIARYADSDGYEKDGVRPYAWLYRDWVIRALNRDLPFDRFTVEQLAGDLLPEATLDQKTATGFHRNTLTNKEGGVDKEEFRCKAVVDRANTTATAWLGLTLGCAECHSHKYDPISQREYYQWYAFFNQAQEVDLPAPQPRELAEYQDAQARWSAEKARRTEALAGRLRGDFRAPQDQWEIANTNVFVPWTILRPRSAKSEGGADMKILADGSVLVTNKNPATDTYNLQFEPADILPRAIRLEALDAPELAQGPGRAKTGRFVLSEIRVGLQTGDTGPSGEKQYRSNGIAIARGTADISPTNGPIAAAFDGKGDTGWVVAAPDQTHVAVFELDAPVTLPTGASLVITLEQQAGGSQTLGWFRISASDSPGPLPATPIPDELGRLLTKPARERTPAEQEALAKYYREEADAETRKLKRALADQIRQEPPFPETKVAALSAEASPRKTHVHVRGDFLRKGDEVLPGTLAVLHAFNPRGAAANRLDLAQWLMEANNPLTARVVVNRYWHHLFGSGLVRTLDDFGTRGEPPSHPGLLDWLATELPHLGWSQKALLKLIVTSATYRQSSAFRPDLEPRDPFNRLWARQNRFRLPAENVRDAVLGASGLLHLAIGGPSVRPPLPADMTSVGYANSIKWPEGPRADRYRRGLYTFFQRTVPYPMLVAFDAPDSNVTCTRRERSNTPLQALTLLNDPVFFEGAQALGRGVPKNETVEEALAGMFYTCLSRPPLPAEQARLRQLFEQQHAAVTDDAHAAEKIAGAPGEDSIATARTAALVGVARVLMNLDEFLTRE